MRKSHPTGHASAKVTHTGAQCLLPSPSSHTLKLSPPLPAKPFTREYLWNLWGGLVFWRHLVAMKHEVGWQKLANIFPEATHEDMGVEGRFLLLHHVNHFILHKVYMCAHDWHRCVTVTQDGKKTFRSINIHTSHAFQINPQPQKHHSLSHDFSSCKPKCLVCKSALPIGTALLKRVSCNDKWLQHGLE